MEACDKHEEVQLDWQLNVFILDCAQAKIVGLPKIESILCLWHMRYAQLHNAFAMFYDRMCSWAKWLHVANIGMWEDSLNASYLHVKWWILVTWKGKYVTMIKISLHKRNFL